MKETIEKLFNVGIEWWVGFIIIICLLSGAGFGVVAVSKDHNIECYYLSAYRDSGFTVHGVYAFTNWQFDELVFASTDSKAAMEVLGELKQCAGK